MQLSKFFLQCSNAANSVSDGSSAKSDSFEAAGDLKRARSERFGLDPLAQEFLNSMPPPAKSIWEEPRPTRPSYHQSSDEDMEEMIQRRLEEHPTIEKVDPDFYCNLDPRVTRSLNVVKEMME
ncbi:hypothetical protein PCANC_25224 [Puccinia coronata f. sp. avenae]|uniref:Uncharacterized protein n=1 Tax=Puccinia coronata f. sp. avenae TaxID=200324 RepID=A0A2N5TKE3_9BASI|nr:hypothetical protein PCANC_25224 [Puccinia coronata f. sp. avenae]